MGFKSSSIADNYLRRLFKGTPTIMPWYSGKLNGDSVKLRALGVVLRELCFPRDKNRVLVSKLQSIYGKSNVAVRGRDYRYSLSED